MRRRRSKENFMDMQKPIVLITGAEGRLGKAIGAHLADAYEIVGFERECKNDSCINADLTSDEALAQGGDALRCIHDRSSMPRVWWIPSADPFRPLSCASMNDRW